jgi:hypothetical protein
LLRCASGFHISSSPFSTANAKRFLLGFIEKNPANRVSFTHGA